MLGCGGTDKQLPRNPADLVAAAVRPRVGSANPEALQGNVSRALTSAATSVPPPPRTVGLPDFHNEAPVDFTVAAERDKMRAALKNWRGRFSRQYPLVILCGMAGAAVVGGNTGLLKPSNNTPVIAAELVRLCLEAGFPPGVFNLVTGRGSEVGARLVEAVQPRMDTNEHEPRPSLVCAGCSPNKSTNG